MRQKENKYMINISQFFKLNNNVNTIQLTPSEDSIIQILKYLPVEDKNDLINLTLQNSLDNGVYNLIKRKVYFELYIVYLYTDLEFSIEEKNDPMGLYDILKSNGIIDAVLNNMEEEELMYLTHILEETMEIKQKYNNTVASVIHSFIDELPKNAEAAKNIIEQFNPESFQEVIKFAQAANGNRPID